MYESRLVAILIIALLICGNYARGDGPLALKAEQLQGEGRTEEAVATYLVAVREAPADQPLLIRAGECCMTGRRADVAAGLFLKAVEADPVSFRAPQALFLYAEAANAIGNREASLAALGRLALEHPGSRWNADAALLRSGLDGQGASVEANDLELEKKAESSYREAITGDPNSRIQRLQAMIDRYGRSYVVYEARLSLGRLLAAKGNKQQAIEVFQGLQNDLGPAKGESFLSQDCRVGLGNLLAASGETTRAVELFSGVLHDIESQPYRNGVRQECLVRLAALKLRQKNREESYKLYVESLAYDANIAMARRAAMQGAGALFEVLQDRVRLRKGGVTSEEWEELRNVCDAAAKLGGKMSQEAARSDLMKLESYVWSNQPQEAISTAREYVTSYTQDCFTTEIITARYFLAGTLIREGYPEAALPELDWILAKCSDSEELWPNLDVIQRVLFYRWQALFYMDAPDGEVLNAANELKRRFPESGWNRHIELETKSPPVFLSAKRMRRLP